MKNIAIIGYGEAGSNMAEGLSGAGAAVSAYDLKFAEPEPFARMQAHAARHGVRLAEGPADCVSGADIVFALVETSSMDDSARSVAPHVVQGQVYVDMNSAGPGAKGRVAAIIDETAAAMADGAVMADVPPTKHQTPILTSGPGAAAFSALAQSLDMRVELMEGAVGDASAIKMLRSVLMKGISSLILEFGLAAEQFGATEDVLRSVGDSIGMDLVTYADRAGARQLQHAGRRAHEMKEVAITLKEAGVEPLMSAACAEQLARIVAAGANAGLAAKRPDDLTETIAILARSGYR